MPEFRLHVLPDLLVLDDHVVEERAARATSGEMWRVLSAGTTYAKLAEALEVEYAGDPDRADRDIDRFIAELRDQGLEAC
jgi:hypothetical protein